ncbi:hypothetical protein E1A91_D03G148100v1 [Gossypium mustelinum]|uniref:Uncharacterized protein n=1 Tax=Gossypium mustelinum TaxID=34275 RepID=A0A5D2VNK6_GOSMU|nr:hypothetical protein E1A91_D03G148100v1 [Gossypium mustelinum]
MKITQQNTKGTLKSSETKMKNKTSNSYFFVVETAFLMKSDLPGCVIFDWLICVSTKQLASIPKQYLVPAATATFIQKPAFEFHCISVISEYYSVFEKEKKLRMK